ncbi:NUDIX domain-containing protein [Candidatus Woesearchaeota archaeon]|nr:NUDIX domain-containing protein [Candidatus Woesearchaeota archaeon]
MTSRGTRIVHSSGYNNPIPTTDAIIEYRGGIVLITRKNPPHGIAIPGGFAEGGLTLEENVRKEAMEETSLTYIVKGRKHFAIFDAPDRDPRGHMISIAYAGTGYGELRAGDDAAGARVYSIDEVKHLISGGSSDGMKLAFDHAKILSDYISKARQGAIEKPLGKAGVVGRFRPLHIGSALMLEAVCGQANEVVIGIGSSNKYNSRNPFTAEEARDMIDLHLGPRFSNYRFAFIQDYGHIPEFKDGKKWAEEAVAAYGTLDCFVTGNEYAKQLLAPHYPAINSYEIIPRESWIMLSGTMVRTAIAQGSLWKPMVPVAVADYLERNGLVGRFRKEFGLETIAAMADEGLYRRDAAAEKLRVAEG